jgi:hypothetical protein
VSCCPNATWIIRSAAAALAFPTGDFREALAGVSSRLRLLEDLREGMLCHHLRRRRDEWIEVGAMDALEGIVRETYDRVVGLELEEFAVDCCITKAPCGGEKAGRSPVIAENGSSTLGGRRRQGHSARSRDRPPTATTRQCWRRR